MRRTRTLGALLVVVNLYQSTSELLPIKASVVLLTGRVVEVFFVLFDSYTVHDSEEDEVVKLAPAT